MDRLRYVLRFALRDFLLAVIDKKQRRSPGFSRRSFAKRMGFSATTFHEMLHGRRKLTQKSLKKLMANLACDADAEAILAEWADLKIQSKAELSKADQNKILQQIIQISQLAENRRNGEPLFVSLIVAAEEVDFEFLYNKVMDVMKTHCNFRDVYEMKISFLAESASSEDAG